MDARYDSAMPRHFAVVLALFAIRVVDVPAVGAELPGLLFHLSFDRQTVTADFAAGEGRAPSMADPPGWKFAPGVKGFGLVMQPDQRCTFPLARNFDTRQGTL